MRHRAVASRTTRVLIYTRFISHATSSAEKSFSKLVIAELRRVAAPVRFVRPVWQGSSAGHSAGGRAGTALVLWSIDSGDRQVTTSEVIDAVVGRDRRGDRVDTKQWFTETTLTALASFLPRLRAFGFELTTVSDVLELPGGR